MKYVIKNQNKNLVIGFMSGTEETGRIYRYKNKGRIWKTGSDTGAGTGHNWPPPDPHAITLHREVGGVLDDGWGLVKSIKRYKPPESGSQVSSKQNIPRESVLRYELNVKKKKKTENGRQSGRNEELSQRRIKSQLQWWLFAQGQQWSSLFQALKDSIAN